MVIEFEINPQLFFYGFDFPSDGVFTEEMLVEMSRIDEASIRKNKLLNDLFNNLGSWRIEPAPV